ncbi:hypothetical protein NLI96_g9243 [Meripilus lineatus]|uniref:Rhodanese domain-containing protein n=1 Tax=Meripilus lineatus TaxID=2056292 RepID=A0AAD5YFG7_9APHY|nr:hypothetical protein NLI96_g9243 [Physisporinus lineatus]
MFRAALLRTSSLTRSALTRRLVMSSQVTSPLVQLPTRAESTQAQDPRKATLEARTTSSETGTPKFSATRSSSPNTAAPDLALQDAYLIDVREPDEVLQGSIPSSVNLPLSVLANALHMPPVEFKQQFGFDKPKHDQEVTFYCRSGKRSTSACDVAKRNGYNNILNYVGSWMDWVEREGKKTE